MILYFHYTLLELSRNLEKHLILWTQCYL